MFDRHLKCKMNTANLGGWQGMIYVYSELQSGFKWLRQYRGTNPNFACILGFTATGLIPGISAAGATPQDREYTAIADAEFLATGVQKNYHHPLPILAKGISPTFISRGDRRSAGNSYLYF